jgi:hypothetical protein
LICSYSEADETTPGTVLVISNITLTFDEILTGIRIRSFNDTVASAQIIGGGLYFNFISMKFVAHGHWIFFAIQLFGHVITTTVPTTTVGTTTQAPDIEIQRWGIINDQSVLLSK